MGEIKKEVQVVTRQGEINVNLVLTIRIEDGKVASVEAGTDKPRPIPPMPQHKPPQQPLYVEESTPFIPDLGDDDIIVFGKEI